MAKIRGTKDQRKVVKELLDETPVVLKLSRKQQELDRMHKVAWGEGFRSAQQAGQEVLSSTLQQLHETGQQHKKELVQQSTMYSKIIFELGRQEGTAPYMGTTDAKR